MDFVDTYLLTSLTCQFLFATKAELRFESKVSLEMFAESFHFFSLWKFHDWAAIIRELIRIFLIVQLFTSILNTIWLRKAGISHDEKLHVLLFHGLADAYHYGIVFSTFHSCPFDFWLSCAVAVSSNLHTGLIEWRISVSSVSPRMSLRPDIFTEQFSAVPNPSWRGWCASGTRQWDAALGLVFLLIPSADSKCEVKRCQCTRGFALVLGVGAFHANSSRLYQRRHNSASTFHPCRSDANGRSTSSEQNGEPSGSTKHFWRTYSPLILVHWCKLKCDIFVLWIARVLIHPWLLEILIFIIQHLHLWLQISQRRLHRSSRCAIGCFPFVFNQP